MPLPMHVPMPLPLCAYHALMTIRSEMEYDGTAEHCCICISGRACVERFVDLLAALCLPCCCHLYTRSLSYCVQLACWADPSQKDCSLLST